MKIDYSVYCYSCHCNKCVDRDVYVGKSKYGTDVRHKGHVRCAKRILNGRPNKKDIKFDYFLAKHGDFCQVRTIQNFLTEDEMNEAEIRIIAELKTDIEFGGMNFDSGGKGGRKAGRYIPSIQTRQRQSESMKAHYKREPFTQEAKDNLSIRHKEMHKNDPLLGKRRNEKTWKTIFDRRNEDPQYEEQFRKMQYDKAVKGGQAFLKKLEDKSFFDEYSEKVSTAVGTWCKNNPDALRTRTQKIVENRTKNSTWAKAMCIVNARVTKEERIRRAQKGWETRRKNLLNKLEKTIQYQDDETTDCRENS